MGGLYQYGNIPVSTQTVQEGLAEYRSAKDKITALEKEGALIRLKNGLYVISNKITDQDISLELIANHLYGPSYVSFESALSYHGLIPERVYVTKSASIKRGKKYNTPLGVFEYIKVPEPYYPVGLQQVNKGRYVFLMATPEKAICDTILATRGFRIQSVKAMREFIIEDLRIDLDEMPQINLDIIQNCIEMGAKKSELRHLLNFLQNG